MLREEFKALYKAVVDGKRSKNDGELGKGKKPNKIVQKKLLKLLLTDNFTV